MLPDLAGSDRKERVNHSNVQVQRTASAGRHLLPVQGAIQDLLQSLQHQVTASYEIK